MNIHGQFGVPRSALRYGTVGNVRVAPLACEQLLI